MVLVTAAHAQATGSNTISLGWFRVMPNSSSDPLLVKSIGSIPVNQSQSGTDAKIQEADTVGLVFMHFFTDSIAVELVGGTLLRYKIEGTGSLSGYGEIGSAKQWSSAVLTERYFFNADTKFRPYVGLGLNYTWFSDEKVMNSVFQTKLAGPGSKSNVSTDGSLNPVSNVGTTHAITKDWFADLSVSYLPLRTTVAVDSMTAIGVHVVSEAKIEINSVVTFLNVGYHFQAVSASTKRRATVVYLFCCQRPVQPEGLTGQPACSMAALTVPVLVSLVTAAVYLSRSTYTSAPASACCTVRVTAETQWAQPVPLTKKVVEDVAMVGS